MEKTESHNSTWSLRTASHRPLVILATALAVVFIVLTTYLLLLQPDSPAVSSARRSAAQNSERGDYAKAYAELKAVTNQAKSAKDQVALYNDLAAAAANAGKPLEAIDYLTRKHQLDPSSTLVDAQMLGTLYENMGEPAKAREQYQRAIAFYKSLPGDPDVQARIQGLEAQIAALETPNE